MKICFVEKEIVWKNSSTVAPPFHCDHGHGIRLDENVFITRKMRNLGMLPSLVASATSL